MPCITSNHQAYGATSYKGHLHFYILEVSGFSRIGKGGRPRGGGMSSLSLESDLVLGMSYLRSSLAPATWSDYVRSWDYFMVKQVLKGYKVGSCHCQNNCSYQNVANLLSPQNSDLRPVKHWRTVSHVEVDLKLYTIVNLDTSLQILTTYIWFNMVWKNEFINWDPKDYCDISDILVPDMNFWVPDLYIYEMTEYDNNTPVIPYFSVSNNGKIENPKPLRIVSSCKLNVTKFPFDVQTCSLSFGPYIHTVVDVIMHPKSNSSSVNENSHEIFVSKGDWSLLDITVNEDNFTLNGDVYSTVKYKIKIKRSPVVYIINLIIPACFMVILDIASMFIQIETGERIGFKITLVLGFSVLLLILNNMLPTSNNTPILGIFCCVCLGVMVGSILTSIATAYMLMLSENQYEIPPWIRIWVLKHLARVLFFKLEKNTNDNLVYVESAENDNRDDRKTKTCTTIKMSKMSTQSDIRIPVEVNLLRRLLEQVLKIRKEIKYSKEQKDVKSDWHFAAAVVDRLVFIVYLLIVIIMFLVVIIVWAS
ncbi:5-hydroxytryptamine receptor 3A-like [Bufo bufo]|uniref:5-hydroxytryptamine receptor 3A-like n=1 Tax=Bufo bufo TaxID=8384 RepID=UPI001ABE97AD|nr:5-hydroxytryptamine receptor 3A-like [Bufo bufo]